MAKHCLVNEQEPLFNVEFLICLKGLISFVIVGRNFSSFLLQIEIYY